MATRLRPGHRSLDMYISNEIEGYRAAQIDRFLHAPLLPVDVRKGVVGQCLVDAPSTKSAAVFILGGAFATRSFGPRNYIVI